MYELLSNVLKYVFILIIYLFIFGIMRLIYMDIKYLNRRLTEKKLNLPYLKLLNLRDSLDFNLEESYVIGNTLNIGRSKDNDIILHNPYFSSKHAKIFKQGKDYFIQDLRSTNGTTLNGMPLGDEPVSLKNGDIIRIGNIISFIFVDEFNSRGQRRL